jgi:hypothetical protein
LIIFILLSYFFINMNEFKVEFLFSLYYGFLMCKFTKMLDNSIVDEESILHFEKNEKYKSIFGMNCWVLIEECYFNKDSNILYQDLEKKTLNNNTTTEITETVEITETESNKNTKPEKEKEDENSQIKNSDNIPEQHEVDSIDLSDNADTILINDKKLKDSFVDISLTTTN